MSRRVVASLVVVAVAFAGSGLFSNSCTLHAAPEPSIMPLSWELTFKHQSLERIYVDINGKKTPFWFMRYTVINNSGHDVLFTPNFELDADTGTVLQGFKDVPNDVFLKIKELYKNDLLQSPTAIYGKLLQGEDNAKDGVAIFTDLDKDARDFKLFVTGLSGETAEVKNPITGKPVILQKTLELDYNLPGQAIDIEPRAILRATKWVMK